MNKDMCVACDDGILNIRVGAIIMKDGKILMVGNLSILHDDCADTNIQNSIVTGYAHIFVHCFSTLSPFCYFKTYFHALLS